MSQEVHIVDDPRTPMTAFILREQLKYLVKCQDIEMYKHKAGTRDLSSYYSDRFSIEDLQQSIDEQKSYYPYSAYIKLMRRAIGTLENKKS